MRALRNIAVWFLQNTRYCQIAHRLKQQLRYYRRWYISHTPSARTNLLTARASSRPPALKCLNWQSLHEFSLNTDISMCVSGLTCARARALSALWWRSKCSYSIHQLKHTLAEPCFFVRVIYNKPYRRFKLNRGPSVFSRKPFLYYNIDWIWSVTAIIINTAFLWSVTLMRVILGCVSNRCRIWRAGCMERW